jgi:hypothetical protein
MKPKPLAQRWRLSLKSLLIYVAVIGIGLGLWESSVIRRRDRLIDWVESHGGWADRYERPPLRRLIPNTPTTITMPAPFGPVKLRIGGGQTLIVKERHIPMWRELLGDVPMSDLGLPYGSAQADVDLARSLFPEADVSVAPADGRGFF